MKKLCPPWHMYFYCCLVLFCGPGIARAGQITAKVTADHSELRLSQSLIVKLVIVGDAPLRVELPDEILGELSTSVWTSRPLGAATLEDIGQNQQRWTRVFQLDPFQPGNWVIEFVPTRVYCGQNSVADTVQWEPLSVKVTLPPHRKGVISEIRDPTGIETVPDRDSSLSLVYAALGGILFVFGLAVMVIWLRGRRTSRSEISPEERARNSLAKLTGSQAADFAGEVSRILRDYLEAKTNIPATKLTTAELEAHLQQSANPILNRAGEALPILAFCDRIQFAGLPLEIETQNRILQEAQNFVERIAQVRSIQVDPSAT